jgi:hypothetical protein
MPHTEVSAAVKQTYSRILWVEVVVAFCEKHKEHINTLRPKWHFLVSDLTVRVLTTRL